MKIYYQGIPGAYSYMASRIVEKNLNEKNIEIVGLVSFEEIWRRLDEDCVLVLPVENSYAGPIHENLYSFLRFDAVISGEILLPIEHCLLSKAEDISQVEKAYSHQQALAQCYSFLNENQIEACTHYDTAGAVKFVAEQENSDLAAIASEKAAEIYGLNVLKKNIADQTGNTTKFFVIQKRGGRFVLNDEIKYKNKVSILFQTRHIPSALYKCLGAFATEGINLTKIESMPSFEDPFSYYFWLDFEGSLGDERIQRAMEELEFFARIVRILG